MKSSTLMNLSVVVGLVGILALISAWIAGENGQVLGMSQRHLYADAVILLLIAIWFKLGAIYHKGQAM